MNMLGGGAEERDIEEVEERCNMVLGISKRREQGFQLMARVWLVNVEEILRRK